MGACKRQSLDRIAAAVCAGVTELGENYVQETRDKQAALTELLRAHHGIRPAPTLRWRMIGHLQRNKARRVIGLFNCVDTIDRVSLAYFGSMPPEGYGIKTMPLTSFAPPSFPVEPTDGPPPKWIVISATHLVGLHLPGDLYAAFREKTPDRILGHTLFVYRTEE